MSSRSGHHLDYQKHHHPQDHGRTRRPAAHAAAATASGAGYTIVHAGKQVRFGPVVFWIAIGTVTVLGMWSAATATYFAFRDDVLTRLIARQAEMQYGYEDRIAELRAKVDRTTSRQLLDQEQFDQKLDQIMRRGALSLDSLRYALESAATDRGVRALVVEAAQSYEQPEAVIRWHYEQAERLNDFELAAVERRLAKIPQEIHEVNTRIAEHDQRDYMGVAAHIEALNSLESKLSDLETRWLELTEQLEGTTGGPARASSNAEY